MATAAAPGFERATAAESESLYEVVDGRRVELPPMSADATWVASQLTIHIGGFAAAQRLGTAVGEMLFVLDSGRNLRRRPGMAFVSAARWPLGRPVPRDVAWGVVPDLAVEVVSPTDYDDEVHEKLEDYFRAGSRQVWLARPSIRRVYLYRSPMDVRIVDAAGEVDGGDLLPGFRLSVAALFPPAAT
jgi:Uma2 family endonuclease